MDKGAKSLVFLSILVITFGFVLLWLGLKSTNQVIPTVTTPEATSSATFEIEGEKVQITKVIDGDTFEIEGGLRVRLVGIDTPETVDPRRPVGCFGKEASNKAKELLDGKIVILQKDISETDKYGRLLRYVYLPLEDDRLLFVNDYLVREGYANTLTYPPDVEYTEQFLQAERAAREAKKGLWEVC